LKPFDIVFFGTPEFALPSLSLLAASNDFEVKLLVTVPDRRAGRGMKFHSPAAKVLANELKIPVAQVEEADDPSLLEQLKDINPYFVAVVAYGHKLPNNIINLPTKGCVNLHPSLLPLYRGAAPIQWSLINGDSSTGVTTQFIAEKWDSGDVIYQENALIEPIDNFQSLSEKLAAQGAHLLLKSLLDTSNNCVQPQKQNPTLVTMARRINKEQGRVDWDQPALQIHNLVRGLTPSPGVFTFFDGKRVKILKTKPHPKRKTRAIQGEVVSLRYNDRVIVKTGKGDLLISRFQPEGSSPLHARDFINGYHIAVGNKFSIYKEPS
jgi:methionyl-tRNA formyltransferase